MGMLLRRWYPVVTVEAEPVPAVAEPPAPEQETPESPAPKKTKKGE